jgi:hypothetical protein
LDKEIKMNEQTAGTATSKTVETTKETEVAAAPVTTDASQAKDSVPVETTETTTVSETTKEV